jgi:hypothetical protein
MQTFPPFEKPEISCDFRKNSIECRAFAGEILFEISDPVL